VRTSKLVQDANGLLTQTEETETTHKLIPIGMAFTLASFLVSSLELLQRDVVGDKAKHQCWL